MLRRYELTDQEWKQIINLLPPENTGKRGRPGKANCSMLNTMVWIARSGAPCRDIPERYGCDHLLGTINLALTDKNLKQKVYRILMREHSAERTLKFPDKSLVVCYYYCNSNCDNKGRQL
ncbi:transposase [Lacrimispora sp.]|uniref:transposase n=1 Tax=Lacrimispora sp. TaxID=2719234 RepID=UPI0034606434